MINHIVIELQPYPRGMHLITNNILEKLGVLPESGMLHLILLHTSAGLSINENADPDVRIDLNYYFDKIVTEKDPNYTHILEGSDDMPAHIKSMLCGVSLSLPIIHSKLGLGIWQGIYLCEFRNRGGRRKIVASLIS